MTQAQAAKAIGVSEVTVYNWENKRTSPPPLLWKAIIAFLGYDPDIEACGDTLSARLKAWRRAHGRSIKQAAQYVGVDESTWAGWERGNPVKQKRHGVVLGRVVGKAMAKMRLAGQARW
jgi:DNA-binding XRE family transcriptional regulator